MLVISLLVALSLSQASAAEQTGRISGHVTLAGANTPIAGAHVMLIPVQRPTTPMAMPPQATTDQDGRYEFNNLAPGGYRINVQKPGLAPLNAPGPGQPPAPIVQVGPGQRMDGVDRQLQKGAVIAGRIVDARGEPQVDVMIMVMRRVNMPGRSGMPTRMMPAGGQGQQTNDLGEFRVSGLAPGEYYVAAMPRPAMGMGGNTQSPKSTSGRTTLGRTFYPGTTDEAAAQPLAVAAGAEVGNINFAMQTVAAFRISGTVVDESGNPVANAMVMLTGDLTAGSMGPVGNARTADDGRFVVNDVPAGTYRANATILRMNTSGGTVGASTSFSSADLAANQPAPIVVTDADVSGVRVVVRRPQ